MKRFFKIAFILMGVLGFYLSSSNDNVNAATVSMDENNIGINALPTTIDMSPLIINEKATTWYQRFTLYFTGGTGTYRWTFDPADGSPAKYSTTNHYRQTVDHTYSLYSSQSKNTWYPNASVSSSGTDNISGKVHLYR